MTRHMQAVRPRAFWVTAALAVVVGAAPAGAQTSIPPSASDFAMAAAQSDEYEVQAARDALGQSQTPRIRAFAQMMIEDHTRAANQLRQAVMASGLPPPPPAMSGDQAMMLSALQSLRGSAFDEAYSRQQVLAHRQALAVEQSYAGAGADANLRAAAQADVPMVRHHLDMATQLAAVSTP